MKSYEGKERMEESLVLLLGIVRSRWGQSCEWWRKGMAYDVSC